MAFKKSLLTVACIILLLSCDLWIGALAGHHHHNRGNSGIEMLLAAGILAKLLNKHHGHHHQSHPVPIPIPVPVHHGGGEHEVVVHGGHHGHHDHHGHGSNAYYDYAGYVGPYYAA
ncbi:hypothetical protein X975_05507, partial [Stegodyphus mimosarum]